MEVDLTQFREVFQNVLKIDLHVYAVKFPNFAVTSINGVYMHALDSL